jgi:DNA-binding SARP family transcriptional activator
VYLAFHRHGVRSGEWAVALWPARAVSAPTIHSTTSDARRALGVAEDGREHLPRSGRCLLLSDTVGTDVDRFQELAASANPLNWVNALRLVRGLPFACLRHADWAVFDGTQARVESMVAEAALRAAAHFTARGQGAMAEWVIHQALRACPYDERLYRALLRAVAAQGNRAALPTAMSRLLILAGEEAGPLHGISRERASPDALHPQTAALYRCLLEGSPAAGGDPARL